MSAYLQAADDAGLTVLDAGAEGLDLGGAGALHGILEVDVLRHAHLCVEQRRAALVAQLLARVLQASNHPRAALRQHTRNQVVSIPWLTEVHAADAMRSSSWE